MKARARLEFQERDKGTLAQGKLADMVLLSRDISEIDPVEIEKVSVELTVMDGKAVFQR